MDKKTTGTARWYPVPVLIPSGVAIPILTATVAQTVVRGTNFGAAIADAFSPGYSQSLTGLLFGMAWNFLPFAVLMMVAAIVLRYCSVITAWLTSVAGTTAACLLFAIMHFQAEYALLEKHWTAAALASGFAALYATAAAFVVAAATAALMWSIRNRDRPPVQE